MKLFLDDLRREPEGWELINTVPELTKEFLDNKEEITHISLDNSLGWGTPQGKTFVDTFIENEWYVPHLWIHSSDYYAVDYMQEQLEIAQSGGVISKDIDVKIVDYPNDFDSMK